MQDVFKVGKKLKSLRFGQNYTQEYVAEQLGVHVSTYSDYELGKVKVSPDRLLKAAELYSVDLSFFYSREAPAITMHDQSSNGYVERQYNSDKAMLEKMWQHIDERAQRFEELYARTLELFDRLGKNKT